MRYYRFASVACGLILCVSGCGDKTAGPGGTAATSPADGSGADAHAHPHEGPHHGTLVELGNEEFHAEVVHDENAVTVYVLDSSATKAVPVDAKELTINLTHDGNPEQFRLAASPDDGDPAGKASRFTLADAELVGHIDDESSKPKLMITINNTPYRGAIEHAHDHE